MESTRMGGGSALKWDAWRSELGYAGVRRQPSAPPPAALHQSGSKPIMCQPGLYHHQSH